LSGEPILTLKSVCKNFGGVQAVQNLSLDILGNQVYGLIGPNGAGKTTVFNLITGVHPCSSGSIHLRHMEVTRMAPYQIVRMGVARTFQTIRLFQTLTTLEHVLVGQNVPARLGREQKRGLKSEAEEILNLLGLWGVRSWQASILPYGIQRKVEIARALATRPRLLLLDEPAAGLNIQETEDLLKTLFKIRDRGVTLLIIEHDMRVIMGVCSHILVLNFGQKIAEGAPDQIRGNEQVIEAYLGRE
jgi:branched-chain amino acid transport system ATP-binding protein